jgi:hypothetical protein
MTFDLFGGGRLLLAGSRLGWFWVAAGVLALVLLVWLYREERRLVSRRAGLGLLGLRLAAAAVLVLALFEPIAAQTFHTVVKGRVVVALDVSESMATADPQRPAEDSTRLTQLLALSPGSALGALPRREIARRLLEAKDGPIARLAREHATSAFTFARETAPATLAGLADALKQPARPDDPAVLTTDWQPALAEALAGAGTDADAAPVLGVVLLTDGQRNGPSDPAPTVARLAARSIPIYPVLIGSTRPPRDAAIAAVKAPESVYKGDVATIAATLKLDGYAGRAIAVTLDRPGASPLRQVVNAPADGSRPVVTFRVPMDDVGMVPLSVAIAPLEGDARPDNDRRTVSVQVADDKARVLLVDGDARWEFRYLRNALARDPRVMLEAVLFHQPQNENMTTPTYPAALPARPDAAPATPTATATATATAHHDQPDPLGAFDAVIIGDVDPADVTPETWARLEAYAADRGGTLVLSAGPRHWPALASNATARTLLPVLDPQPIPVAPDEIDAAHPSLAPGIPVLPTRAAGSDSSAWPMLQLASELEESLRIWSGLPRLPWVLAGKPKPGATVLATARDLVNTDAEANPDAAAVIAAQPYGLGKVFWVGTGDTWRWRHRVGDAYHHRFWGQVVRWAAASQLTAGSALVRFGAVRPRVGEGEAARLQARISEGVAGVSPDLLVAARVFKADPRTGQSTGAAVALVPLRALAGQPRTFEGSAPPLPLGAYTIRLDVPQLAEALHLDGSQGQPVPEATLHVLARDTSERVELAAARDPVDRLAAATGGRVFADFEADGLPPLLHARTRTITRTQETRLWDQPAALLLFFAILTAEWVARKRVGLP